VLANSPEANYRHTRTSDDNYDGDNGYGDSGGEGDCPLYMSDKITTKKGFEK
jgi:hypothetical protein